MRTCAERPGRRILNAADPDAPAARLVVEAIAQACGRTVEVFGLGDDAAPGLGWSPWGTWPPFFLDTTAADALGHEPAGTYAATIAAEVDELCSLSPAEQRRLANDPYFADRFDYDLDDVALSWARR